MKVILLKYLKKRNNFENYIHFFGLKNIHAYATAMSNKNLSYIFKTFMPLQ